METEPVGHAYLGAPVDEDGNYRAICKCGWRSPPAVTKNTVVHRLINHKTTASARDEAKAKKERSARGKKAYQARKRAERAAKREEVSA